MLNRRELYAKFKFMIAAILFLIFSWCSMRYITCTNPLVRYARVRVRWCFNIFSHLHLPRAITVIPHSATDGDHLNFLVNHLFCYSLGYTFFFFRSATGYRIRVLARGTQHVYSSPDNRTQMRLKWYNRIHDSQLYF